MKTVLLSILVIALLGVSYALGTFSARDVVTLPEANWTQGSESAEAWREYTASLEASAARIFSQVPDARERREGIAFLGQLASAAFEMKVAKGSAERPAFTDWMGDYRKFLGDSPDAIYHTAQIAKGNRYEVSGNRGEAGYISFTLYGRQINGWNRAAGSLSNKSMRFDDNGNFRVLISATPPDDPAIDWLPLEDDVHMVMVRQYYHGRKGRTLAHFAIRNLSPPPFNPETDAQLAASLREAATFVRETLEGALALTNMMATAPNDMDPPPSYSADFGGIFYPTSDNDYFGTWFSLADDEALVLEGAVPDAPYWAVSLQNRWMQSMDYENYQSALNDREIETEDGRYRVVISAQRPPSGNWLDTTGAKEGILSIRYQHADQSEKPTLTLVKRDAL